MKHILALLVGCCISATVANAQQKNFGDEGGNWRKPAPAVPAVKLIPLPPVEYDHAYLGQLNVTKWNDYSLIRFICSDNVNPIACSYRTYVTETGAPVSCLIMLGPKAQNDPRALRHEIGHCNGWSEKHEGAR